MKLTIFTRLLLATLIPVSITMILLLYVINNIAFPGGSITPQERLILESRQIKRELNIRFTTFVGNTGFAKNMLAYVSDEKSSNAIAGLKSLLETEHLSDAVWFIPVDKPEAITVVDRGDGSEVIVYENLSMKELSVFLGLDESLNIGDLDSTRVLIEDERINLLFPVKDHKDVKGVLGITTDWNRLIVQNAFFAKNSSNIRIISSDGIIFSHGNLSKVISSEIESANDRGLYAAAKEVREFQGIGASFLDDKDVHFLLSPLYFDGRKLKVSLFVSMDANQLYSAVQSPIDLVITTSVLCFILLGFSIFVATRGIIRPIRKITKQFNQIAKADITATGADDIDFDTDEEENMIKVGEIDALHSALFDMLEQLKKAHDLNLKVSYEKIEKEKILARSEAKTKFFASMSHEIRTPMNAVIGISDLLLHDENLGGKHRKYIQDIKVSSSALLTIINDILDLSRVESGRLTLSLTDFNFINFINDIRSLGELLCLSKGLGFSCIKEDGLPPFLHGDDVRLRQVLVNIVGNASKYTNTGEVIFKVSASADKIIMAVSDTGIGIRKEYFEELFEPFSRVSTASSGNIQGTGLGLSISKHLVDLMGGEIQLESQEGIGSTFTIIIPRVDAEAVVEKVAPVQTDSTFDQNAKVLVVDDNEINLSVAEGILKDFFELNNCDVANSGINALKMVSEKKYDIIFMDQMMPGIDGLETTRRIRQMPIYKDTPIIGLTANVIEGAREESISAGMNDYLTKPIDVEALRICLERWI